MDNPRNVDDLAVRITDFCRTGTREGRRKRMAYVRKLIDERGAAHLRALTFEKGLEVVKLLDGYEPSHTMGKRNG